MNDLPTVPPVRAVLVPLDGSDLAELAMGPARVLGQRLGVGVGAVQVVDHPDGEHRKYLEEVAERHGLQWAEAVAGDDVAATIRSEAAKRDAVICMATSGHGRTKAVFGSTAEAILAGSTDPIVVVGRSVDPARIRGIERIVVALDGSPESELVCGPAVAWAAQLGLVVNLITVVGEPMPTLHDDEVPRPAFGPHDAGSYIEAAVRRHSGKGADVVGEVLVDPLSPASGLGRLLRDIPHCVLAMATSGRTGLQRLLHGSVAGSIVDESPVPVVMFSLAQLAAPQGG